MNNCIHIMMEEENNDLIFDLERSTIHINELLRFEFVKDVMPTDFIKDLEDDSESIKDKYSEIKTIDLFNFYKKMLEISPDVKIDDIVNNEIIIGKECLKKLDNTPISKNEPDYYVFNLSNSIVAVKFNCTNAHIKGLLKFLGYDATYRNDERVEVFAENLFEIYKSLLKTQPSAKITDLIEGKVLVGTYDLEEYRIPKQKKHLF